MLTRWKTTLAEEETNTAIAESPFLFASADPMISRSTSETAPVLTFFT